MADYKLSKKADKDLQDIAEYGIKAWGYAASLDYRDRLKEKFQNIADNPLRFPAVEHVRSGYRRCIFYKGSSKLSIYYRIHDNYIEIIRLIGRQSIEDI